MKNRVLVNIAGIEYTLIGEENEAHIRKIAGLVDDKIREVTSQSSISALNAAILASVNIAEENVKLAETNENLRRQLKEYIDELSKMKFELAEARRELARTRGPAYQPQNIPPRPQGT